MIDDTSSFFESETFVIIRSDAAITPQQPLPELTDAPVFSPHCDANAYDVDSSIDEQTAVHPMINTTSQYNVRTFSFKLSIENITAIMHIININIVNPTMIAARKLRGFMNINIKAMMHEGMLYDRLRSAPMLMFKSEKSGEKMSIALIAMLYARSDALPRRKKIVSGTFGGCGDSLSIFK